MLDRLLRGESVSSSGPYYPITEAVVRPQAVQLPRPPLLVGALGAMTRLTPVRSRRSSTSTRTSSCASLREESLLPAIPTAPPSPRLRIGVHTPPLKYASPTPEGGRNTGDQGRLPV